MDQHASEQKHVNLDKFHNPSIPESNTPRHEGAITFLDTVRKRARTPWINLEINRMIMYLQSHLKVWVIEEKNVFLYIDKPEESQV